MASNFPLLTKQTCPKCGVVNQPTDILCSGCQVILPSEETPPTFGTWNCQSCRFINTDASHSCVICDEPRREKDDVIPSTSSPQQENAAQGETAKRKLLTQQLINNLNIINRKCHQNDEKFVDEQFLPAIGSDSQISNTLRHIVKSWQRPEMVEVEDDEKHFHWELFNNPKTEDLIQGQLGNCWLLAAVSAVAGKPNMLEKIFATDQYNKYGAYGVQIYIHGEWTNVIIDDLLPCNSKGKLVFAKGKRKQLWPSLLEKAFAKVFGGYEHLSGSSTPSRGLTMMTGCASSSYVISDCCSDQLGKDNMYNKLRYALESNFILSCNTGLAADHRAVELYEKHAYLIIGLQMVFFESLVRLWNPHGEESWTGRWSARSNSWDDIIPELRPKQGVGSSEKGTFWMSMDDFTGYIERVTICYTRDDWFVQRVQGHLPMIREEYIDRFKLEIEENTTVDVHVQNHALLYEFNHPLDSVLIVYDERWGLVGTTTCVSFGEKAWTSNLLTPGRYYIYIFSYKAWITEDAIDYTISCHSNKNVQLTKVREKSDVLADVLFYYAKEVGNKRFLAESGKLCEITAIVPYWRGCIVAIVNECSKPYVFRVWCDDLNMFIQSRPGRLTADVIPPNTRQISQIFSNVPEVVAHGELFITHDRVDKLTEPKCNPNLTEHTVKIHRQIPIKNE